MSKDIHKFEIDFRNTFDVDIKMDGENINGISNLNIDIQAGKFPEVILTPAVNELQFGDQASVDVYVDQLELKTVELLLGALNRKLGIVNQTIQDTQELTATEALNSFIGWLTTRTEPICAGAAYECSEWAELIKQFSDANSCRLWSKHSQAPHPRVIESWIYHEVQRTIKCFLHALFFLSLNDENKYS